MTGLPKCKLFAFAQDVFSTSSKQNRQYRCPLQFAYTISLPVEWGQATEKIIKILADFIYKKAAN